MQITSLHQVPNSWTRSRSSPIYPAKVTIKAWTKIVWRFKSNLTSTTWCRWVLIRWLKMEIVPTQFSTTHSLLSQHVLVLCPTSWVSTALVRLLAKALASLPQVDTRLARTTRAKSRKRVLKIRLSSNLYFWNFRPKIYKRRKFNILRKIIRTIRQLNSKIFSITKDSWRTSSLTTGTIVLVQTPT